MISLETLKRHPQWVIIEETKQRKKQRKEFPNKKEQRIKKIVTHVSTTEKLHHSTLPK